MKLKSDTWSVTEADKKFVARMMRETRLARGLTPTECSKVLGFARSSYYAFEAGRVSSSTARMVTWLLKDHVDSHDPVYWRERALLAERRLVEINAVLKEYSNARRLLIDDDASEPNSVSPRKGSRVRAA